MTTSPTGQPTSQPTSQPGACGPALTMTARAFKDLVRPVLPHAATSSDLPVLNAVHMYTHAGHVIAEATDRYTLGISRTETTSPDGFDAVLSLAAVRRILAMFKPSRTANATLTFTTSTSDADHGCEIVTVTVTGDAVPGMAGATLRFDHPGHHFPTLRAVLATVIDGTEPARTRTDDQADTNDTNDTNDLGDLAVQGYNAEYLARFAVTARKREPLVCHRTPNGLMTVTVGTDFLGAIMAVRLAAEAPQATRSWAAVLPPHTDATTPRRPGRTAGVAA